MAEALTETGAAMATSPASGSAADAAAARDSLRPHPGRRGAAPRSTRRPSSSRSSPRTWSRPEWHAVEKKLRKQPLPVAGRFFAWLTDGMSEEHRAFLKQTVPTPVVTVLSRVFGRRYYKEVAPDLALTCRPVRDAAASGRSAASRSRSASQRGTPRGPRSAAGQARRHEAAGRRAVGAQPRHAAGAALLEQLRPARRTPGGCRPSPARAKASPSSSAVSFASLSRSQITSRWSLTNPTGKRTTAVSPAPGQRLAGGR